MRHPELLSAAWVVVPHRLEGDQASRIKTNFIPSKG
jgi:hypothetical protein